ncbi:MFS transporter [Bacillus timonensis]|nr:MFS transporter [Bacillus timonensis]
MELTVRQTKGNVKINFMLFYFFVFFSFGSLFPLLSVYLKDSIGLTGTQIGIIMSISPVITILIQPFWGIISDYTQKPKLVLMLTLIATAVIGFTYSFVSVYLLFILIAGLLAVTQSAIIPVSDSLALTYVQKHNGNYGSIRLWGALGFAVSVLVVGRLAETYDLSIIFYVFTCLLLFSVLFVRNLPGERQSVQMNIKEGISTLIKMPRFVLFLFTTFLVFGPIYANNFYFGIFVRDIGGTLTGVGIAFLLAAGSEAPFMQVARSWINKIGILHILVIAAFISAVRWLFYFFEPSLTLVYMTTIAQGFSVGLFIPAALQYVRDISPGSVRATAVSFYSAFGNGLGSWFCTFMGGIILDAFDIGHVYLFFSLLTGIGIIVLLIIINIDRKKRLIET